MGGSLRLSSLQTLILVLVVLVAIANLANIGNLANNSNNDNRGVATESELLDAAKAKSIFKVPRANSKVHPKQNALQEDTHNSTSHYDVRLNRNPMQQNAKPEVLSGTTSTASYFYCGGYRAAHYWGKDDQGAVKMLGQCAEQNIAQKQPPFQDCGEYDVWTDTGYAKRNACFYPSIDGLNAIYEAYPNSTFLMVVRNTSSWHTSFQSWYGGKLYRRWKRCNATGMSSLNPTSTWPVHFHNYYEWHQQMVREFVQKHPSLTYVEVQLESPETPHILENAFGISASCWGKCDPKYHCTFSNDTDTTNLTLTESSISIL